MTPEQHGSKTEGRVAEINAAIKQIMNGAVDALTNEEYIAIHNLQTERSRLQSATPSPQSPPEPERGDDLTRQERMAELEREIADIGMATGVLHHIRLQHLNAELSRLRNEGGGGEFPQPKRRDGEPPCGECHLQPGETCDICGAASPSDLPTREAIERTALIENIARKCMAEWVDLNQASETAPDFREYRKILERGINKGIAALQPLSQGNGEAVAWREAVDEAIEFIADEYRDPSYEPQGEWLPPQARRVHRKLCEALSAAPPSQPEGLEIQLRRQMLEISEHAGAHLCRAERAEKELAELKAAAQPKGVREALGGKDLADFAKTIDGMEAQLYLRTDAPREAIENVQAVINLAREALASCLTIPSCGLVEAAEWQPMGIAPDDPDDRDPNERVSIPRIEILNRDKRITALTQALEYIAASNSPSAATAKATLRTLSAKPTAIAADREEERDG